MWVFDNMQHMPLRWAYSLLCRGDALAPAQRETHNDHHVAERFGKFRIVF